MLVFYYTPDTCALASHIALEEAGAEYRLERLSFETQDQRKPDYLKVNPKGRVPALVTGRGILTETPAILAYIAQVYPLSELAPIGDPHAFAEIQAFNSYICSTLHVAHAHRMRGYRWADDESAIAAMQRKVPDAVGACYAYLEEDVFQGPFVFGEKHTIADPYLFTVAQWMEGDGLDPADYPKIAAHRDMMRKRPCVQAAIEAEFKGL